MHEPVEQIVDEILVIDAQSGSIKAFEILVLRWQRRLWRYAYRLTQDSEAAWDVTQESWLGIVRGIPRLNDAARFEPWAYRIVTNKANDWIRRNAKSPRLQTDCAIDKQRLSDPQSNESSTDLQTIMRRLPSRSRTVLALYYLEGFGLAEAAGILRVPTGTVKSRLFKARQELKQLWEEHFDK